MAKTIEELKESINNTINQNGTSQITGQGLNILLNEMADVLSTMGGSTEDKEDKGMNTPIIRCIAPDPDQTNGLPYVNEDYQEDNIKLFEKLQENNGACPVITVSCEKSYENGGLHYIMNSPALALWYIENPDEDIIQQVVYRTCLYDGVYSNSEYIMNFEFINDGPLYIFGFSGDYYGAAFVPCSYSIFNTNRTNGVCLFLNKTGAYLAYNYFTGGGPA